MKCITCGKCKKECPVRILYLMENLRHF
ncbi:4Fe-4S binding protein [uncultured Ilyobacter sp.]